MIRYDEFESPLGVLLVLAEGEELTGLHHRESRERVLPGKDWSREADFPLFGELRRQLGAYAEGRLRAFDLPLAPRGTPFQRKIWRLLREIPFGSTLSYGALGLRAGRPGAGRAVGAAMGRNPLLLIQPCHRVIGGDGSLCGFGAGLDLKKALLDFEARILRGEGGTFVL
jgi:methylated-DNA-[protein]-cysteine S-methyltransferase